eukprot:scaffold51340_cov64-Phaeocystis_antarctica.AAC.2
MAPRAVRRVVWVPSRATFSTSMAQAVAGGHRPFAGWRDVDRARWDGRGRWRVVCIDRNPKALLEPETSARFAKDWT